jgi:HD-GYP domain-containing protein (c-di-GMP phosphodiesterase class II)
VTIDIRSILLADFVAGLAFLSLSAFTWRRGRGDVNGSEHWFAGFSCLTIGIGLVAFRGPVPAPISIQFGNGLILAGVALKVFGIFRYLGVRARPVEGAILALFVATMLCLACFEFVVPSMPLRMLVLSATSAVYGSIAAFYLLLRSPRELRNHARVAAALYSSFAAVYLYRVVVALTWKGGQNWLDSGNIADSYAMMALMVILAGLAVAEMLLLHGKLESTLRRTAGELGQRNALLHEEVDRRVKAEADLLAINRELGSTQREIMLTLSEIVEFRSKETASHVARVGEYARALSLLCGSDRTEADLIGDAAPMHDIGKISIPDDVLNKTTGLDPEELKVIQSHTIVGYHLLAKSDRPMIRLAATIALEHHERWGGGGYPYGKAGESISFAGRVVCLCDVFDALAFARPYKDPWEHPRILEYILEQRGSMFDPCMVDAFLGHVDDFLGISEALNAAS